MLSYNYCTYTSLKSEIDREISRAASITVGENGTLLYDTLRITDRDIVTMSGYVNRAANAILAKFWDIASKTSDNVIQFGVTLSANMQTEAINELKDFMVMSACGAWFEEKNIEDRAKKYAELASSSIERADVILRTTPEPERV